MPLTITYPPLTADDAELAQMVAEAELPALLVTLAHITGDFSLLEPGLRPRATAVEPQGGMSAESQHRARELALAALIRFRDSGSRVAADPTDSQLRTLMAFVTGEAEISEDYLPLLQHQIGLSVDVGAPNWTVSELAPDRQVSAVVIGAGMSGLLAAHRLRQAGVEVSVLERNADVGGVWFENRYPGCRLDTNNFGYSYSFAQRNDWPNRFSSRDSIHDYFVHVAQELDLGTLIQFETAVTAAVYDDGRSTWTVTATGPDGQPFEIEADMVVSAVGQLNTPNIPNIAGRDKFSGSAFHTARWPEQLDLTGRRVAVVGTGASAFQVIPSIADEVGELTVYQRTAPWTKPTPDYHDDIPDGLQRLFKAVPYYHNWYRFYQFWGNVEGFQPYVVVDPEWREEGSVSAANAGIRKAFEDYMHSHFADRPDLLAKVVPSYPPGAKRLLRDNGVWARTLHQPHVELVTDPIAEMTEKGIRTADGELREHDVVIWGTGFKASDFLSSLTVRGRGGRDLHEVWSGDARAYLGIMVPGFPNFFCLYGPNANLAVNGSLFLFSECEMHFVLESLREMLAGGRRSVEVTQEAFDAFAEHVDAGNAQMAWGASNINTWYKNAFGRVSQNWPFSVLEFWKMTRRADPEVVITS